MLYIMNTLWATLRGLGGVSVVGLFGANGGAGGKKPLHSGKVTLPEKARKMTTTKEMILNPGRQRDAHRNIFSDEYSGWN